MRGRAALAGARPPVRSAEAGLTAETVTALQATAGNAAVTRMLRDASGQRDVTARRAEAVQRAEAVRQAAQETASEPTSAPPGRDAGETETADATERLSASIESGAVTRKLKLSAAPETWVPESWLPKGKTRLRRTLMRRVIEGGTFSERDIADIKTLSGTDPGRKWLKDVGIGTHEEASTYVKNGKYGDWLKLPPGKRILIATLDYNENKPAPGSEPREAIPGSPSYTLGRFMTTRGLAEKEKGRLPGGEGLSPGERAERDTLLAERDEQIRRTAVRTLNPSQSTDPTGDDQAKVTSANREKDARARGVLESVLLILQHGLTLYDPKQGKHVIDSGEHDVIRALAHGGRVNIRIPAVRDGESTTALTDFLGVTEGGSLKEDVAAERGFASHRTSIGENKDGKPGRFTEKGGFLTGAGNFFRPGPPKGDPGRLRLMGRPRFIGVDISGGGLGSLDCNGDVVLPDGSHGHMLLVFTPPTGKKDGSLMVGIETLAPHKRSPVGYVHNWKSTEATANPESVLHGHKPDKVGGGKLKDNARLVDLGKLGGDEKWDAFLKRIKQEWVDKLKDTAEGSAERDALYRRLIGPRPGTGGQSGA